MRWQSHGTYGRALDTTEPRPSWLFPLSDFTDLARPVTLEQLRSLELELRARSNELAARWKGSLYLPFAFSNKRPLRTAQGYLTKLPASFVALIPGLEQAFQIPVPKRAGSARVPGKPDAEGGTGYQPDQEVRKAIERHAVDFALRYFTNLGYLTEDVGASNPYDVLAIDNTSEFHIEVKGSVGTSTTVELTAGEVNEATTAPASTSLLLVVDQIKWTRSPSGVVNASGGRARLWKDWKPDEKRLTPTSFRYLLPPGSEDLNTGMRTVAGEPFATIDVFQELT